VIYHSVDGVGDPLIRKREIYYSTSCLHLGLVTFFVGAGRHSKLSLCVNTSNRQFCHGSRMEAARLEAAWYGGRMSLSPSSSSVRWQGWQQLLWNAAYQLCSIVINEEQHLSNSKEINLATFQDQFPYSKHLVDHALILTGTAFGMKKKRRFVINIEVVVFCLWRLKVEGAVRAHWGMAYDMLPSCRKSEVVRKQSRRQWNPSNSSAPIPSATCITSPSIYQYILVVWRLFRLTSLLLVE
jgi:hypothetical protein